MIVVKSLLRKSIYLLGFLLMFQESGFATHSAGMEIFYRWKPTSGSDSTYEFTVIFYRNCYGFTASAPSQVTVRYGSVSLGLSNYSFNCSQLPTSGSGVPPLQPANIYTCLSTSYCLEEYVYRGTWTSPRRAKDWLFSYELCCLPNTIAPSNMQNGTLYNECGLNNLDFPDYIAKNTSPFWHNRRPNHPGYTNDTVKNPPNVSVCEGRQVTLNESVRNYDNDSIDYSFFIPQQTGGLNNTYIGGYSFSNPIPTKSGLFTIDSITGKIKFIPGMPDSTGIYMIGIKATEYRSDTTVSGGSFSVKKKEIGFVKRTLFIMINDSATCPDTSITFSDTSGSGAPATSVVIDCPKTYFDLNMTINLICESIDTNASCVQVRHVASNTLVPLKRIERLNCTSGGFTKKFRIHTDTLMWADTFELVFKPGTDGNTVYTQCYKELDAYADTLTIVFKDYATGEFLGDKIAPSLYDSIIKVSCNDSNFVLNLSEPVRCKSIASDGSDFQLIDLLNAQPVAIKRAQANCTMGRTSAVTITTIPLSEGLYALRLTAGSDNNTLYNKCSTDWPTDSILVVTSGVHPNIGPDTIKCLEDTNFQMTLKAGGLFPKKLWSTGDTTSSITVYDTGTYVLVAWNKYSCLGFDTMRIKGVKCYAGITDQNSSGLRVYPNPGKDVLKIEGLETHTSVEIILFNLQGEHVYKSLVKKPTPLISIDLTGQAKGLYFLQVTEKGNLLHEEKIILR